MENPELTGKPNAESAVSVSDQIQKYLKTPQDRRSFFATPIEISSRVFRTAVAAALLVGCDRIRRPRFTLENVGQEGNNITPEEFNWTIGFYADEIKKAICQNEPSVSCNEVGVPINWQTTQGTRINVIPFDEYVPTDVIKDGNIYSPRGDPFTVTLHGFDRINQQPEILINSTFFIYGYHPLYRASGFSSYTEALTKHLTYELARTSGTIAAQGDYVCHGLDLYHQNSPEQIFNLSDYLLQRATIEGLDAEESTAYQGANIFKEFGRLNIDAQRVADAYGNGHGSNLFSLIPELTEGGTAIPALQGLEAYLRTGDPNQRWEQFVADYSARPQS